MTLLEIKILYFKKYYTGNKGEDRVLLFYFISWYPEEMERFPFYLNIVFVQHDYKIDCPDTFLRNIGHQTCSLT